MKKLEVNGLVLPLNDSHVYQRRGVVMTHSESKGNLHFTVLRCLDGRFTKTYFGLARCDNEDDFIEIMKSGDKFEPVSDWFSRSR